MAGVNCFLAGIPGERGTEGAGLGEGVGEVTGDACEEVVDLVDVDADDVPVLEAVTLPGEDLCP